ncbi:hypothetical protein [Nesterenkonia sp. PF2B19]|uniref:hypothetical protein n=1 Tax=Nesterenkonia sp. PF2B19 TaxID=1881858 RepID=UPI00111C130F|nr:hypothetical protein [Nesterenkonia sp. PF2B19]
MPDAHPDPHLLTDLALGTGDPEPTAPLVDHVSQCPSCRRTVADSWTPWKRSCRRRRGRPRAGAGVTRAGRSGCGAAVVLPDGGACPRVTGRLRKALLPSAAAVTGLTIGAGIMWGVLGGQPPAGPEDAAGFPLVAADEDDADPVGEVSRAYGESGAVLVIDVVAAPEGRAVTCLVRLADGTVQEVGEWPLGEGGGTWVVADRDPSVVEVLLIDQDGQRWASSRL